jgi:hypothetical protein
MPENFRRFPVNDPFGRTWDVEFRWQQNAISIRHADAIDCKYYVSTGEERRELVVSLPHAALLAAAGHAGRELSDAWVTRLAGLHVEQMISGWEDLDKAIAVLSLDEISSYNHMLEAADARSAAAHR